MHHSRHIHIPIKQLPVIPSDSELVLYNTTLALLHNNTVWAIYNKSFCSITRSLAHKHQNYKSVPASLHKTVEEDKTTWTPHTLAGLTSAGQEGSVGNLEVMAEFRHNNQRCV